MIRARKAKALATISILVLGLGISQLAWGSDAAADEASSADPPAVVEASKLTPVERYATDPEYRTAVQSVRQRALRSRAAARGWCTRRARISSRVGRCTERVFTQRMVNSRDLGVEQQKARAWRESYLRHRSAYKAEIKYWARLDRSTWKSIDAAAREYRVSASWLHACVSSEGGHGGWVMNHQGSGAGGWFQFMKPTFYGYVGRARSGNRFPKKYARWNSRVGQAYTAAYMFKIGESNQWSGSGC